MGIKSTYAKTVAKAKAQNVNVVEANEPEKPADEAIQKNRRAAVTKLLVD